MRCCATPGCPTLVPRGHCATHRQARDLRRGSRQSRGYGREWEKASQSFLREFPLCGQRPNGQLPVMSECHDKQRLTWATQTDHVVPHKGYQVLFWDRDGNWQALCRSCGARKSQAGL